MITVLMSPSDSKAPKRRLRSLIFRATSLVEPAALSTAAPNAEDRTDWASLFIRITTPFTVTGGPDGLAKPPAGRHIRPESTKPRVERCASQAFATFSRLLLKTRKAKPIISSTTRKLLQASAEEYE